jgi:glycosyltransferase involved in cell wall biosynthesis
LTGHVPDELLPALYSGAIAAPYLSVYEGFGLPPLEAMACGTPSLTGNLASLPEVVGDAGLMVDPYDVDAIADGLLKLIEDSVLRSTLSYKGLERAKEFSWEKTAELTWKILKEAAEKNT